MIISNKSCMFKLSQKLPIDLTKISGSLLMILVKTHSSPLFKELSQGV